MTGTPNLNKGTSEAPQDVAALRELAEEATPGPWTADCVPGWGDGPGPNLPDAVSGLEERVALNLITGDARYIAAASPDVVLGLLDQNDRLRSALREQWESNHYEHCRNDWPHSGRCTWPLPDLLQSPAGPQ